MRIVIELNEMSKDEAQDILNEIDERIVDNYGDKIESMEVRE